MMKKDKCLHTGQNNACCAEQRQMIAFGDLLTPSVRVEFPSLVLTQSGMGNDSETEDCFFVILHCPSDLHLCQLNVENMKTVHTHTQMSIVSVCVLFLSVPDFTTQSNPHEAEIQIPLCAICTVGGVMGI